MQGIDCLGRGEGPRCGFKFYSTLKVATIPFYDTRSLGREIMIQLWRPMLPFLRLSLRGELNQESTSGAFGMIPPQNLCHDRDALISRVVTHAFWVGMTLSNPSAQMSERSAN